MKRSNNLNNKILQKIEKIEKELLIRKGQYEVLTSRYEELKSDLIHIEKIQSDLALAVNFLSQTAKDARNKTIKSIESLATAAVKAVYDQPMEIRLQYKEKGKSNSSDKMTLQLVRFVGDEEVITGILDEVGGGLIETVSFALRIACLKWLGYTGPIILDEAYKSLSKDEKIENIAVFLSELNQTVGNQIIFSTHAPEVFESIASKSFIVTINNGKSEVNEC